MKLRTRIMPHFSVGFPPPPLGLGLSNSNETLFKSLARRAQANLPPGQNNFHFFLLGFPSAAVFSFYYLVALLDLRTRTNPFFLVPLFPLFWLPPPCSRVALRPLLSQKLRTQLLDLIRADRCRYTPPPNISICPLLYPLDVFLERPQAPSVIKRAFNDVAVRSCDLVNRQLFFLLPDGTRFLSS